MTYLIPEAALDDRQAFVGTSGSGKTYAAGTAVERILTAGHRAVIIDPLGVWWGLRSTANGKKESGFPVVILGGEHGDLALNDRAGAIIGEAIARSPQSFILDLSALGTAAAERRFVLGFLSALYRKTGGEPFHLVIDEADMFAPQHVTDKDGEAVKLLGMMETVVRRGRVKGFIPWLISQRPAVLNKNVLSQADGLIAMKLTSAQDRAALGSWIEGQADRERGKEILAQLPTMPVGDAFLWLPARGILKRASFPKKITFDSSRTPSRGETRTAVALKPIDLGKLGEQLAEVEAEAKANDPAALRAEIARLRKDAAQLASGNNIEALKKGAETAGRAFGIIEGRDEAARKLGRAVVEFAASFALLTEDFLASLDHKPPKGKPATTAQKAKMADLRDTGIVVLDKGQTFDSAAPVPKPPIITGEDFFSGPQRKILASLGLWAAMGKTEPTRSMVAMLAGYKAKGGSFRTYLSQLSSRGAISGAGGRLSARVSIDALPDIEDAKREFWSVLSGPQQKIVRALIPEPLYRDDLARACGYEPGGGSFRTYLSQVKTMELVMFPGTGSVALEPWVREIIPDA